MNRDEQYMRLALAEAEAALREGETPVGAVIVCGDEVIASAHNTRERDKNALRHAEISAIERACAALGGWRLAGCELYVTLEPCPMCAGAVINSRLSRLVYGASDAKAGCAHSVIDLFELPFNHKPVIKSGVLAKESAELLSRFFASLRG